MRIKFSLISPIFLLVVFLSSGCATVKIKAKSEPIFYPAQPEEPRIQYLTSFSSSRDVEGGISSFAKFILGKDAVLKPIVKPYGVSIQNGKIYVCDTIINSLEIIDLNKKVFSYFKPVGRGQLRDPINLCLSDDGNMYVADARRGQVLIFSPQGDYLNAIAAKEELKPTDVAIFNGRIFVCDLKSHSIRVYSLSNNEFLYSIPKEGQEKEAALYSPTNFDIDNQGNIYVSDTGSFQVKKYNNEGVLLKAFGLHGDTPGQLARPKGVALDREGNLYVVDAAFENVQIFDSEGKLLLYFPEPQDSAELTLPAGIFIDYENIDYFLEFADKDFKIEYLIFVVNQYGDRKISVFGFGRKM